MNYKQLKQPPTEKVVKYESVYTLQGSQPYVLTSNWPEGFKKPMTEFVPDYSLQNVQAANNLSNYHPVNFSARMIMKGNKDNPIAKFPYETKPLNEC